MPSAMSAWSVETSVSRACSSRSARVAVARLRRRESGSATGASPVARRSGTSAGRSRRTAGRDSRPATCRTRAPIGDDPGEDVEPAGRALGVGGGGEVRPAAPGSPAAARCRRSPFQHGALGRGRSHAASGRRACRRPCRRAGQEARPHPVGAGAEPQVEAGRLHLVEQRRLDSLTAVAISARIACTGKMPEQMRALA